MILTELHNKLNKLPDELKIDALNYIDFLYFKTYNNVYSKKQVKSENKKNVQTNFNKKITAKQILALPLEERNSIIKEQAMLAKSLYEKDSDFIIPDLIDDYLY